MDFLGMIILLLFYLNQRRSGCYALDDRIFNTVLLCGAFVLLLDGVLWLLDGVVYPGGRTLLFVLTGVSYVVNPLIAMLWVAYCDLRVFSSERGLQGRAPLYAFPLVPTSAGDRQFLHAGGVFHRRGMHVSPGTVVFCIFHRFLRVPDLGDGDRHLQNEALRFARRTARPDLPDDVLRPAHPGGDHAGAVLRHLAYWPSVIVSFVIVYIYVLNRQISTDALTGSTTGACSSATWTWKPTMPISIPGCF
jgi:hypothetical protein